MIQKWIYWRVTYTMDYNMIKNLLIMYEDSFTKDELFTFLIAIIESFEKSDWLNILTIMCEIEKKINKLEGIE